jgi:hypothetical protein
VKPRNFRLATQQPENCAPCGGPALYRTLPPALTLRLTDTGEAILHAASISSTTESQ